MPNRDKIQMYRNIGRIAHALERVATVLENEQSPAPAHGVPLREQELDWDWAQHALLDRITIVDKPRANAVTHKCRRYFYALAEWRADRSDAGS